MNKKLLIWLIPILLVVSLVSASFYVITRTTTITATQPITIDGGGVNNVDGMSGDQILGALITVSNAANFDVNVQITSNEVVGIETSYVGVLELTKKNTATWEPIANSEIEITYTVVGDTFEATGVPDGYTLIYYKDFVVGLEGRLANPQPAIIVTSDIGSLPQSDDVNKELENYCQDPDNYDHCNGAKLWVVPTSDITDSNLNWANMADYYYETDLVRYFDNSDGIMVIPAGSNIEVHPEFTLDVALGSDTYIIETTIEPTN